MREKSDNLAMPGEGTTSTSILVIDIGGTNIKFAYNVHGIAHEYSKLFPTALLEKEDPIEALAAMVRNVITETGISPDVVVSTVPGFLDPDQDRVILAGNVPVLNGRRLATELSSSLGIPVYLERDSVLALMGETFDGVGAGGRAVLGIYLGTGVGAAFIQDGKPFRGAGWALEIGHIPFGSSGRVLEGLRTDSLETYVSGKALQLIADRHEIQIDEIFTRAEDGGALASEMAEFIDQLTMAIGIAATLFSPDILVLGGGVSDMANFPRSKVESLIREKGPYSQTGRTLDIRWATLGWRSVLSGAPYVAQEHKQRFMDAEKAAAVQKLK